MSVGFNYQRQRARRQAQNLRQRELFQQSRLKLKSELTRFWTHCNRYDMSPSARLARLKEFAEIVISKPKRRIRSWQRNNFVTGFCRRGSRCFACGLFAKVRHHIIQIQHGGSNSKENIVPLCIGCHAEIHPWLQQVNKSPVVASKFVEPTKMPVDSPPLTLPAQNHPQARFFYDNELPGVEAVISGYSCEEFCASEEESLRGV